MKPKLLATGADLAGITKMINRFWCSKGYTVDPETLEIKNPSFPTPKGYSVTRYKGGYRFEKA